MLGSSSTKSRLRLISRCGGGGSPGFEGSLRRSSFSCSARTAFNSSMRARSFSESCSFAARRASSFQSLRSPFGCINFWWAFCWPASIRLNHHFGCLDDGRHRIALLQPKFFRTATGDDTLNHVLTHSDNDVSHDVSQNKLLNSSTELVPCRDWHSQL